MYEKQSSRHNIAVVVTHRFIPPRNGGEKLCYEFCLALSKRVKLFCVSTKQNQITSDFEIINIFGKTIGKFFNPITFIRLAKLFRCRKIKICIVNQPYYAFAAYFACKFSRSALITYSHNLEHKRFEESSKIFSLVIFIIEFIVYRLCCAIFFISKSEKEEAIRIFRLNRNRCYFVPIMAQPKFSERLAVGTQQNAFSIVFFGDFSFPSNLEGLNSLLFEICPLLAQQLLFPYRIRIFGSNLPKMTSAIQPANSKFGTVEFLGYLEDFASEIQTADVMISPIYSGAGSSMKIMDTLSAGTTVISARTGANGIAIEHCGNKLLLVDDKDWQQYVSMIITVRNDKLHLLPTPELFFDTYSEDRIMNTVLSVVDELRT